ncbi:DsbA family protein [uncultured Sphingomonas sp.]|uniref:DsbA family protein n=1 Tax=uncultured Sphingomonas sp. TaxID=158754 RepID=UPI0035CABCC3
MRPLKLAGVVFAGALAGVVAAAPIRDWSQVAGRTATGAVLVGNPAARVKLVEYVSYTCPHCAAFTAASHATLQAQWVRSGSTSVEVRPVANQPLDLSASLLARCVGPRYPAFADALFAQQLQWFERGADWQEANGARINLYPVMARLRALADGSGLSEIARTAGGLTPAAIDRCFANQADLEAVIATSLKASNEIQGTPSFILDGKSVGSATWASLEPQLRAAGAH